MDIIRGNNAGFVPKINSTIIRETKDHKIEVGKLISYNRETNEMIIQNQDTKQVQKWQKQKNVNTVEGYSERKERQLNVASEIIAALAAENVSLRNKTDGNQKLNLLA